MIRYFQIAGLILSFEYETDDSPFAVIADKLLICETEPRKADIRFLWEKSSIQSPCVTLGRFKIGSGSLQWKTNTGDIVCMERGPEHDLTVRIGASSSSAWKKMNHFLKKWGKYHFLYGATLPEMHAKKIMYGVIEPILLAEFSTRKKTMIHCSAVANAKGEALMLSAWGGVGKTSLMSYFLLNGWKFLCDDIAVLDEDGTVYHYPLPMHIYGFHKYVCQDMYQRLCGGMTAKEKFIWDLSMKLKKSNAMFRWVVPERIYGREAIALKAGLKMVIHMQRSSENAPICFQPCSSSDAARYIAGTIQNELSDIVKLTSYPNAVSGIPCFPDTERTLHALKKTAENAFSHAEVYEMILGSKTTPEETYEFLRNRFPAFVEEK